MAQEGDCDSIKVERLSLLLCRDIWLISWQAGHWTSLDGLSGLTPGEERWKWKSQWNKSSCTVYYYRGGSTNTNTDTDDILSLTGVLYVPRPTLFGLSSQTLINCFSAHHIKIHKAATKNYFILINHWKIISYSMEIKYLGIFKIICCSFCVRRKKHFALNKIHLRRFILIESLTIKISSKA